jgi:aldose 1-epimerase
VNIELSTLVNKNGMRADIINLGAILVSLIVPDKNNNLVDVVLGYDNIEGYLSDTFYFGSIVGRFANRIRNGQLHLAGKDYQLSINDGKHHLHGGKKGFDKKIWTIIKAKKNVNSQALTLKYVSQDGEEGYPGKVDLQVTYQLTKDNEFKIIYSGKSDKTTVLNPTHHSYFNLSGNPSISIEDHFVQIFADSFTPVDSEMITTGKVYEVSKTPMDFRKPKKIGSRIGNNFNQLKYAQGYDHNYVLNYSSKRISKCAEIFESTTGIRMEVLTDFPGLQFYSGNFLNGKIIGKKGIMYNKRAGFCLETQYFPDCPNKYDWPNPILEPDKEFYGTTIYKFYN